MAQRDPILAFSADPGLADFTARPRLGVPARGLQRVSTLQHLLPDWTLVTARGEPVDAVLAWGLKPSAERAQAEARRRGVPLLRAEDGFLRSVGLGHQTPPLSIVLDDQGIYYDAARPSRLEALICQPRSPDALDRSRALRQAWVAARVSKYNHARDELAGPSSGRERPVLVVDQTAGDLSIRSAGADEAVFTRLLEAALDEHPHAPIWLKVHPDVVAGRKRGHFDRLSAGQAQRVRMLTGDVHAPSLLSAVSAVYVVSSQVGFEALLWGCPVHCAAMPFYAGWGLTRDLMPAPSRRCAVALEQLVSAALVDYPRYLDPETRQLCSPERLIEHVALQRQQRQRFAPELVAQGFSQWKKPIAQAFFAGSSLRFSRWWMPPAPTAPRVVWGRRAAPSNAPVIRVEDGFLRSVGLGADLVRPLSWVQDDMGIYFDATQPSRLEALLNHTRFDASLLLRAARLRMAVVAARLTKYNVGERRWQAPARDGRERVLVVGQVESDASIRWGGCTVTTNEDLLRAARDAHPQAQILYKPHPDVLAGLRDRRAAPGRPGWVHNAEVVADVPMADLLDQVDVVHTISSLAGFEALLRGRRVVTWGLPFYAGWGLTDDRASSASPAFARRQRRLALDELVAATLILYPTYVSRVSGAFTTAERALAELVQWREQSAPPLDRGPAARVTRQLRRQLLGWFDHFRRR